MTNLEKLPEGWVFHQLEDDGSGYWERRFGECHCCPWARVYKRKDGFVGEYWWNAKRLETVPGITVRSTALMCDALHENTEAKLLTLRREAAQLYYGDLAAAGVGEDGAG